MRASLKLIWFCLDVAGFVLLGAREHDHRCDEYGVIG